ncbi:Xaa-Pro dipeptidase [Lipingzhangella halophila]|uniref:Xaa-Pro dipeptidase n=1 Tax=Lipingzhangella halophila TaxID=1783352 RepID=A0A7W7RHX2_9ACTN|nr:Xaa-Pro peptidase family protein [Lipingzhangella halophila]MBB4932269.1 Xaa-Pro dipeptidase [Lipingzhangella halophila]
MGQTARNGYPTDVAGLGRGASPGWLTDAASDAVAAAEGPSFDDAEYAARLDDVRHRMARRPVDALLVFRPSSVEYLCGYHTMETAPQPLLVTDSETYLYVPDLEVGRALATSRVGNIRFCGYADALRGLELYLDHVARVLPPGARVGVEFGHASTPPRAVEILRGLDLTVVDADHLVERARLVLSPAEIRFMEQAATLTRAGTEAAVAEAGRAGATDSSVAAAIAAALYRGADSPSVWGPVVATGERAGIPHSSWADRPLAAGTTFLEFAGTHRRYHAPVMRTLVRGPVSAEDRRLAELAQSALRAVLETAKPGVPCSEVATRAAEATGPLPEGVVFHHLYGYPVGLAHKPHWMDGVPFYLTADNHEPLRAGMAFHVPGSYRRFGRSGVGLSQTFVIGDGGTRVLTPGTADLIETA